MPKYHLSPIRTHRWIGRQDRFVSECSNAINHLRTHLSDDPNFYKEIENADFIIEVTDTLDNGVIVENEINGKRIIV